MTTIGLIGFGDVASAFVRGLHERRGQAVPVYCAGARHRPPYDPAFRERVAAAGGALCESPADLARVSDVLISAVVPSSALAVAEGLAAHLELRHLFVDLNSCAPATKRAAAALVEAQGARFADAALLASPRMVGLALPFLASGDGAAAFRDLMRPLGPEVEVLDGPPGAAALIKMLRSVVSKGLTALAVEALVAARRAGLTGDLMRYAFEGLERSGLSRRVTFSVRSACIHSGRRVGEMDEVIATLRDYGVPAFTAEATRRWHETIAALGLKEHFDGEPPADYLTALAAIDEALGRQAGA